ncbi:hypothetical protein H6F75_27330 [Nodosilinea sp. FACHB-131]|uniref:hypothetical protein n=1 Tax=Cyanophyceae TaxID=3028117 RepID=UPI001686F6B5|nr:hypothetical protein [Nodosilinea sp. FACHB-131]MBD1877200.1 hypothetical protein [Nodosilinea sp. FACHB-131]
MISPKMKPPKRVYMGSVGADCAKIMITTPEALDGLSMHGVFDANAALRDGYKTGVVALNEEGLTGLADCGNLASQICFLPPGGDVHLRGILFSSNHGEGQWPIYAELAPDPGQPGSMQFKAVTIWFGFGGDVEQMVGSICRLAGVPASDRGPNDLYRVEDLAYRYGVELDQFTDPSAALKAIELACGVSLAEALQSER